MKLIGLVGKLQSGKSTAAEMIMDKYCTDNPAVKLSFANFLKEMIHDAGLCTEEELWGTKTDFSRLMLQKIGTEIIRKQIDPDFWVKKMREEIDTFQKNNPDNLVIVIDDVRFQNEANLIKEYNGTLIRIVRSSLEQNREENKHLSETEQDEIKVDYFTFNDASLKDLRSEIFKIVEEIK